MARMKAAASPDAFVEELTGWQLPLVAALRHHVNAGAEFTETIKWGNLVFLAKGPCVLIHVEEHRVLLGFWRGKRLTAIEPRIRPSGKYELGNIVFREGEATSAELSVEGGSTAKRHQSDHARFMARSGDTA